MELQAMEASGEAALAVAGQGWTSLVFFTLGSMALASAEHTIKVLC